MNLLAFPSPSPPDWRVDWAAAHERFEWIRAMKGCPQDPVHHAEGDVWIHVKMVCEALAEMEEWRELGEPDRDLLFAAALLHDVAKPLCTRTEDGRITSRGHSQRGAIEARRILWELDADLMRREEVCAMVRYHQTPYYLIERADSRKIVLRISQQARCDLVALLARADVLGRVCQDQEGVLAKVALFGELCREEGCPDRPWRFPSAMSRFEYFQREGRDPHYRVHEAPAFEAILLCGLPGAGKDTWIQTYAADIPVVALDEIREELGAEAAGKQGHVVQEARERARGHLRKRERFVWNATNLTREVRRQLVELFTDYRARVRIVYVEAPCGALFERNARRSRVVPVRAIERMLARWEVPDVWEAPEVEWWENDTGFVLRSGRAAPAEG